MYIHLYAVLSLNVLRKGEEEGEEEREREGEGGGRERRW